MDKKQADAIARAILEPDLKAQEDLNRRRASEAARLIMQRRLAWFGLAGFSIGAAIGYYAFEKVAPYGLIGLCVAVLVGRLIPSRAAA
ncbi:hypothetical protein [Pseudoxanthomonas sp. Root630]|uniref:hypothetical protein n=1 Tax=Pseudoxanthomonas sp. Root630 TaxID=1736574 RepID=UPI0007030309|nr:hypothetical protein [Pseudoxanthomonas sp. Root630]KRA41541.1 hypothetical protein ASD72_15835 [Pseudoxanthomonas sp. Root630]